MQKTVSRRTAWYKVGMKIYGLDGGREINKDLFNVAGA